jgi:hypothetical protein
MVSAPATHGRTEAKDAAATKLQSRQRDKLRGMNEHLIIANKPNILGGMDIQLLLFLMFTRGLQGTMVLIHSHMRSCQNELHYVNPFIAAFNWSWDLSFHVEKFWRVLCRWTCEQYLEVASWPVRRWRPFVPLVPVVHLKLQRPQSDFFVADVETTLCRFCFLPTDLRTLAGCELPTHQTASSASKERGPLLERNYNSSFRAAPGILNQYQYIPIHNHNGGTWVSTSDI